jgi:putative NADH-flavin reductase
MKLLVIGATRGIGRNLVELALDREFAVTALVRKPGQLPVSHDRLRVLKGDIRDRETVTRAVEDQDAVCITIGINPTRKPVTVFSEGAKNVIEAMTHSAANLLICVTRKSADLCHRYRCRRQQKPRRIFL